MEGIILGNRYQLMNKIGSGGMAHVYKALDLTLDRIVAIKILKEEFLDDEEFVKRFHAEAQSVAKLSNPNIVGVFDVALEEKYHYIVMEYIEGVALSEYITSKVVLSDEEAMGIALQICKALVHAHKNNIVHRDIKPHNILLAKDGVVKVADFGIAKATSNKTLTLSGKTIGSVHYFSPEQARGGFVDQRSDLYSLGCVMYEMVTGKLPYDGETPVVVAVKHLQEPVKDPTLQNKDVTEDTKKMVMKAMAKSVDERYQSALEFLANIEAHMKGKELPSEFNLSLDFVNKKNNKKSGVYITKDFTPVKDIKAKREEYDFSLSKKRQKKYTFSKLLAIFSAVLLILLLSFYGVKELITTIIPEIEEYEVGNYANLYYDDIKEKLESEFDIITEKREVNNDEYIEGIIIEQDIAPGIRFKEGGFNKILFTVSLGPELIEIQDFTSFDYRIANHDLTELGLVITKKEIISNVVAKGGIVRTDPEAGMKVAPGTPITVYVSLGPNLDEVEVPEFIGMNQTEFFLAIDDANLKVGSIFPSDLQSLTAIIIEQHPTAGEFVYENSEIHVKFQEENIVGNRILINYSIIPANINELEGSIKVYVEIKPTDTLQYEMIYNQNHEKSEFPITIEIPIPVDGKTTLKVIFKNIYTELKELLYEDYMIEEPSQSPLPTPDTTGGN
ncbi:MAG: Stk1 family PASTA domain-containing Ser/Thr kinase [Clostridiales bacterium]|nr:Stk1 family PASTA domain-containing Ser/Thr kinase [Clostridiales bacterium]